MKIIVTGNFDEMATVLDKLRNIKTKEYAEEIQQGDEDIIKAMRAKLGGLRNILALNVEKKEQTTLTANEAADLVDFIDTFFGVTLKIIKTKHKGLSYEFRLLEHSNVIEVSKNGRFMYIINLNKGFFACNCPGAKYHKKCWHITMLPQLFSALSLNEPWTHWAEDAGRMMYG